MSYIKMSPRFTAGTTFQVSAINGAVLYLRGPGSYDLNSIGGVIYVAADVTTDWLPGQYHWILRKTDDDGHVSELASGSIRIMPDLAKTQAGTDLRDHNQRVYDAICAVIEKRATVDQQSYKINNRELVRMPLADLLKLKTQYASLLRRSKRRGLFKTHNIGF